MNKAKFVWDPNSNQTFTPADGNMNTPLTGPAESFNKNEGFGLNTTGELFIDVSDSGMTVWGSPTPNPPIDETVFKILPDTGSLRVASPGSLAIGEAFGDLAVKVIMEVAHANGSGDNSDPLHEREGLGISVNRVVFGNVEINISNRSGLQMLGTQFGDFSYLKIDNAKISVTGKSYCHITPNAGEKSIDIMNFDLSLSDNSWAYMDSMSFLDGGTAKFSSIATSDDDSPIFYLFDFNFIDDTYQKDLFSIVTHNGNNKGGFTFFGIGSSFSLTAFIDKRLLSIDGNDDPNYLWSRINRDSAVIYKDGNLNIRLK
ncbi:hypothetical protein [Phyllobacterium leguminum]|uniref:Bulb-type lectin domain-containing protein n=1 Tax=Phyllobacterium leguminum TaxID=314237 RepID=A0A318TEJ6_9HYPH|nr:hypothetical protein [Phyllobacterium leguminum]PYE89923.1 hypothetical protein C7477_1029 [Phyllobacterium leguminum]